MVDMIKRVLSYIILKINNIDRGGSVGFNVKIINRGYIHIGKGSSIRPSTHIYSSNKRTKIIIGDNVDIGRDSTISAQNSIIIEDGVLTGPHVFITDHNHEYRDIHRYVRGQGVSCNPDDSVFIGEGSWLGTNTVVVGNVRIGKHCVIGSNSVVTKDIPDYSVAVGIPCKVIKRYDAESNKWINVK